jgi:hypothetical protein
MFEGKPPRFAEATEVGDPVDSEVLRTLSWNDLVARLAAARELRGSFHGVGEAGDASFDAGSAARIAAHHNGKHSINLDNSSNGKGTEGKAGRAANGTPTGVARN